MQRRRRECAPRADAMRDARRAGVLSRVFVVVLVVVACARAMTTCDAAVGDSIDGVGKRSAELRVFAPRVDEEAAPDADDDDDGTRSGGVRANAGERRERAHEHERAYEYEDVPDGWREATWWEDFARGVGRTPTRGPIPIPYASYDEYVENEVARIESSLDPVEAEAVRETLSDIAHDIQEDLDRVARARALDMTYRGSTTPPANFQTYAHEAYVIYDDDGERVLFEPQGEVGRLMQQLTWVTTIFPGNPTALDDYMRCSTLVRPCTLEELLRKCTWEPRGTWYRERISRMNAPINWPYCQPDLGEVYEFCTEFEMQAGVCDPRRARERMYLSRTIALNGGVSPCLRWRTNVFGVRECIDSGQRG